MTSCLARAPIAKPPTPIWGWRAAASAGRPRVFVLMSVFGQGLSRLAAGEDGLRVADRPGEGEPPRDRVFQERVGGEKAIDRLRRNAHREPAPSMPRVPGP